MDSSEIQDSFVDLDMDKEKFKELGYRAVDMMAEYYSSVKTVPVFPPRTSPELAAIFDEALPETGEDPESILDEWQEKVVPNTTHLGSPRYFGFVNGSGTMIGALADSLAAALNMNPGAWKPAPAATEIERRTIAWLAELIGYPTACGGLFTSGGTLANFTALETALRNTAPYDTTQEGLQRPDFSGRFTVYMSDHEGHVSISRVADLLNLGRTAVRKVASHDDFTMDVDDLVRVIKEDKANGDIPFCVVAQVGSINVGAIDPLEEIAKVCQEYGLWFHADGACGAVGAMLPEKQDLYKGLERADSVTLDPHKWLYIPYECGCVLVRDPEKLRRAFSMSAPYLRGTMPTEYTGLDYFEYGPQMSRGFRALKVWMSLKYHGRQGYERLLRQNVQCAEYLDKLVRDSPDFEAIHKPNLFIYSFRYAPGKLRPTEADSVERVEEINAKIDRLNQNIADQIQLSGLAFFMTSKIHDQVVIRLSICSHRTRLKDIELVFNTIKEMGEGLSEELQ